MKTYLLADYMKYIDGMIELELKQNALTFMGNNVGIICNN